MSILLAAFGAMATVVADITPNAVNWADISSGTDTGTNANQTVNGCGTSITLSITNDSTGVVEYSLDGGAYTTYSTPFSVDALTGQTLNWRVTAFVPGTNSGTITVKNDSDSGTTLDTFTYSVVGAI